MKKLLAIWNPGQNPEHDEPESYLLDGKAISKLDASRYDAGAVYGDVYEIVGGDGERVAVVQGATV